MRVLLLVVLFGFDGLMAAAGCSEEPRPIWRELHLSVNGDDDDKPN